MFATQGKLGVAVMIKGEAFPISRRVTAVTLDTVAPLVPVLVIVTLMTCVTVGFQFFFIEPPFVAGRAFREAVFPY